MNGWASRAETPWLALSVEFGLLLLPLALALALWLSGNAPVWIWPLALLPAAIRHAYQLGRLVWLIRRHHRLVPPFPLGLWGELHRAIALYQQRGRKGRKRQIRFIRRFREAAYAVPDALVILDRQHRIDWANPAAAPLLDIQWPQDDRRPLTEILNHPDLAAFIEAGDYMRPLDLAPPHNRALMLSLRIAPFGARKRQRLVVGRDITTLYHLNMIRRDFVANASHELRTPLTVIAGFLETLADAADTPPHHRRPLSLMQHQTDRMRSIIEDLLTLSRLEMHDRPEEQTPVEIADELETIRQEALALGQGRNPIELDADPQLGLLGNRLELRSAFSNLVFNAVRHTPTGTRILMRWQAGEDGPQFTVRDWGEGIPQIHLPRLTERFYRVDPARSRASGGTGLGLAIVNHVLNRHDAQLLIASDPGQGSTFNCIFPPARTRRLA